MTIGWGTFAYASAAGVSFGLALVFFLFGSRARRFDGLMASLGLYTLSVTLFSFATVRLHSSSDVDDYALWLKIFGFIGLSVLAAVVVLVSVWTNSVPRVATWLFGAATAVIAVLQLTSSNGLLAGDIEALREVSLFGEQFVVHEASSTTWRPVLDVYLALTFLMIFVAIVRGYRIGQRAHSLLMAGAVVISIAFSYWDSLVDFGRVQTTYLMPFASLAVAAAGAVFLAERSVRTDARLVDQTARLEEIVIERTAALIESNRQLEDQVTRQRASARSLRKLTEQFELTNEIVDPDPSAIEDSLLRLLGQLSTILGADVIELRLDNEDVAAVLPRTLTWRQTTAIIRRSGETEGATTALSETIDIGSRTVGSLTAWTTEERVRNDDLGQYLGLAAKHLSGLMLRLDLVAQFADSAVEQERQRIAMDLHDSVTQQMYSVAFLADAAVHQPADDPVEITALTHRIRDLVLSSLAELRVLLLELKPHSFADVELHVLLEQLADDLATTCSSEVVVDVSSVTRLPPGVKTALYRITQEAASNACRHGHADEIAIELNDDGDEITLVVRDDGVGFEPLMVSGGAGLDNLRARARFIDAALDIVSHPGDGTSITVRLARAVTASESQQSESHSSDSQSTESLSTESPSAVQAEVR